ncbi:MAG TPA: carbamoyltransferase C-terminal domain-containing protein [Solirubrobacteraceae bacterium]|nr:carbamoyltransferase C-terminal domain-containing protein [Solirubrobacteraceae bacterium]
MDWVLGLGGSDHDFSAAVMRGGDIRVAVESERVTRIKYGHTRFNQDPLRRCVQHVIDAANAPEARIARVVSSDLLPTNSVATWDVHTYRHHLCHAASAVMLLPPTARACVLVYDGNGTLTPTGDGRALLQGEQLAAETFSFFDYADGELHLIGQTCGLARVERCFEGATNSLGNLYEIVTDVLGFAAIETGKTMGLAGWGTPTFLDDLLAAVTLGDTLDTVFTFDTFDQNFRELLVERLRQERFSFKARADLAASVQEIMNRVLLHCYTLIAGREFDTFCVAGGCALNTVANGLLAAKLPPERTLVVPPAAGDSGIALGSLWLDRRERTHGPFELTLRGASVQPSIARPGRTYATEELTNAIRTDPDGLIQDPTVHGAAGLAHVLAEGSVIGFFHGSSEIGPRALGGRSILADPRRAVTKERINREIKLREPFRPLAPIVLAEHYGEYFEPAAAANPYMLVVATANARCRQSAPAIVHVDGTARVQVIDSDGDPFLISLLSEFHSLTGLPMLVNTSFNCRGEPIVETPDDAITACVSLGLDGLWLQDRYLTPPLPQ